MQKTPIWLFLGAIALLALGRIALGQAGSIGGTVGNANKSISGGQESEAPAHAKARTTRHASASGGQTGSVSSCGNIVGTWSWPNGSEMAFYKNGTAGTSGLPPGGTWKCVDGTVYASFANGGKDEYTVGPDGNSLTFTTNWLPGRWQATRKNP